MRARTYVRMYICTCMCMRVYAIICHETGVSSSKNANVLDNFISALERHCTFHSILSNNTYIYYDDVCMKIKGYFRKTPTFLKSSG